MRKLAVLIALFSVAASAPDRRADEVRATEIAFAKAFADRDAAPGAPVCEEAEVRCWVSGARC